MQAHHPLFKTNASPRLVSTRLLQAESQRQPLPVGKDQLGKNQLAFTCVLQYYNRTSNSTSNIGT